MSGETPAVRATRTRTPLYARIASNIREEILNGELEPGQRLQEKLLAERYGVSRVPVREALRRLEVEQLVQVEANRGAVVRRVTAEEAAELLGVRVVLEELLGREAAKNRTDEQVEEMRQIVAEGTSSVRGASPSQLVALNTRFHRLLGEASHNSTAAELVEQLRTRSELEYSGRLPRRAESSWKEHTAILEAIAAGDPEQAAASVRKHLSQAAAAWGMSLTN
jgi:DNA-binding GntR family transcriptional regulator